MKKKRKFFVENTDAASYSLKRKKERLACHWCSVQKPELRWYCGALIHVLQQHGLIEEESLNWLSCQIISNQSKSILYQTGTGQHCSPKSFSSWSPQRPDVYGLLLKEDLMLYKTSCCPQIENDLIIFLKCYIFLVGNSTSPN